MNLADWRASRTHTMELPSGLEVKVKQVGLEDLLIGGHIPAPLLSQVQQLTDSSVEFNMDAEGLAQLQSYAGAIDAVARACLVDPPVADEADDTHLAITELPFSDRLAVFKWANEGAAALAPFREEPIDHVDSAQPGDDVREPALADPGR